MADIRLQRVVQNLSLDDLTVVTQAPSGSDDWYLATRSGLIGKFENVADVSSFTTILDYRNVVSVPFDGGLIQLVIHPNYPADRRVFVNSERPGACAPAGR